jgi:hypothetical protein
LRNIFHDKNSRLATSDNLKIRTPEFFAGIPFAIFVEETESLAWWTSNNNIGFRDFNVRRFKKGYNISANSVWAEIGVVSGDGIPVEIVSPYGNKWMSKEF